MITLTQKELELILHLRKYEVKLENFVPGRLTIHWNKENRIGKTEFSYYKSPQDAELKTRSEADQGE